MDVVGSKRNMTEEDNTHSVSYGLQQAMTCARMLDVPFAYHSTGNNVGTALLYQSDDLQFYDNMDISPAIKMISGFSRSMASTSLLFLSPNVFS